LKSLRASHLARAAGVPVLWVYVGGAALGVSLLLSLILLLR
jgi:hypothetical protein